MNKANKSETHQDTEHPSYIFFLKPWDKYDEWITYTVMQETQGCKWHQGLPSPPFAKKGYPGGC